LGVQKSLQYEHENSKDIKKENPDLKFQIPVFYLLIKPKSLLLGFSTLVLLFKL